MAHGDSTAKNDLDVMLKSGQAFKFFTPFEQSKAYKSTEDGDERMYIETIASSDGEDLVGDIMSLDALSQMQKTAVGVLMMRDHNPSVEKIFGTIVEAELIEAEGKTYLKIKAAVDEEDPQNIRIWKLIERGSKLGASVTVIITKTGSKPNKKAGLYITGVKLLEISIVSIPCNQDAWTIAATAGKALRRAEAAAHDTEVMKAMESKTVENAPMETIEKVESVVADESKEETFLSRTKAAIERFKALIAEVTGAGAAKSAEEMSAPVVKGMFNDLKDHPRFWDCVDILLEVKWALQSVKWNLEYNGETDFSEILELWVEALDEFKAAMVDSFAFWEDIDTADVTSLSLEEAEKAASFISQLADMIGSGDGAEQKDALRAVGKTVLETAVAAGLELPVAKADEEQAPPTDDSKSAEVMELTARAEKAEGELETANARIEQLEKDLEKSGEELEAAIAGIQANTEAAKSLLREPLGKARTA